MGLFIKNQIYWPRFWFIFFILLLFNINIYAACPTINPDGSCKKSSSSKSSTTCSTGYYLDSKNKCIACPSGCIACTSDTICTECQPKYALVNNKEGLCMACPDYCLDSCSISSGPYGTYSYTCLTNIQPNPSNPSNPDSETCPQNSSITGTGEAITYTDWYCRCSSYRSIVKTVEGTEIPVNDPNKNCATACAEYFEDLKSGVTTTTEMPYSKITTSQCKCIDSSYSWDNASKSCTLKSQCPPGSSSTTSSVPAASWVCKCRCTNLNTNSPCPSRDTYEAQANPTNTDATECTNKCGPYGKSISQFPYLKAGKENCYCDRGLLWNGTSCSIDKTCPAGSVWCSDGSLSGCFTCPVFPTSISVCNGSKGTIAVQKCERPDTANQICYGRVGYTGGWDTQTELEEDCQCIPEKSFNYGPCRK